MTTFCLFNFVIPLYFCCSCSCCFIAFHAGGAGKTSCYGKRRTGNELPPIRWQISFGTIHCGPRTVSQGSLHYLRSTYQPMMIKTPTNWESGGILRDLLPGDFVNLSDYFLLTGETKTKSCGRKFIRQKTWVQLWTAQTQVL